MKVHVCDVCHARERMYRKSTRKWNWRNGIKVDVCAQHDEDLRARKHWSSADIAVWIQAGCPLSPTTTPPIIRLETAATIDPGDRRHPAYPHAD